MNPPLEVDQQIHNPNQDSGHIKSESINLKNLDSTDYVCEIHLVESQDRPFFQIIYLFMPTLHGVILYNNTIWIYTKTYEMNYCQ